MRQVPQLDVGRMFLMCSLEKYSFVYKLVLESKCVKEKGVLEMRRQ